MNFKSLRTAAAVAAITMGIAGFAAQSVAQTVTTNLTVSPGITSADGADINLGTWFLLHRNGDNFSINSTTAGVIAALGVAGGATNSQAINIVTGTAPGTVTVSLPTGVDGVQLNMQRGVITPFADANLTLQNIRYMTATEADAALNEAVNVPVTVVTGGTPETVNFGVDVAVSGSPAPGPQTASFTVTFAF